MYYIKEKILNKAESLNYFLHFWKAYTIMILRFSLAPIAQLDRALDYGSRG